MRSIRLQARPNTAPQFCVSKIVNAVPYPRQRGIEKAGAQRVTLFADPPERVTGRVGGVGSLQTIENRDRLSEPMLGVLVRI